MYRILDRREDSTESVAIRWDELTRTINLLLVDKASGMAYQQDVPGDKALDAFHHPYMYVETTTTTGSYQ